MINFSNFRNFIDNCEAIRQQYQSELEYYTKRKQRVSYLTKVKVYIYSVPLSKQNSKDELLHEKIFEYLNNDIMKDDLLKTLGNTSKKDLL